MNVKDYRQQIESELSSTAQVAGASTDPGATAQPDKGWADAIRRLADPAADIETRRAALHQLQAATFLGEQFAPYRADYVAALRAAMTDRTADHDLRNFALDVLVNFKDEFARQKLVDGLRGIGEALVAPAAALGLLARDDHDAASGLAREVLARTRDAFTRAQAVRLLGSDANAANDLLDILRNKDEAREVRQASAVALKALDENAFTRGALAILNDASDFDDIRATVRGALERKGIALPFQR